MGGCAKDGGKEFHLKFMKLKVLSVSVIKLDLPKERPKELWSNVFLSLFAKDHVG